MDVLNCVLTAAGLCNGRLPACQRKQAGSLRRFTGIISDYINFSISLKIRYSSSLVSARNMAMRVSRKLGIPLNKGLAAR